MQLWLSRRHDGKYQLTRDVPVRARVRGTKHDDLYLAHGEPIGVQHLCPFAELLFHTQLDLLHMVQVELTGEVIGEATHIQ